MLSLFINTVSTIYTDGITRCGEGVPSPHRFRVPSRQAPAATIYPDVTGWAPPSGTVLNGRDAYSLGQPLPHSHLRLYSEVPHLLKEVRYNYFTAPARQHGVMRSLKKAESLTLASLIFFPLFLKIAFVSCISTMECPHIAQTLENCSNACKCGLQGSPTYNCFIPSTWQRYIKGPVPISPAPFPPPSTKVSVSS